MKPPIKPLSQFLSGIAWATCWPASFQAAAESHPAPILLGGICAILPDTLDLWIAKPFHKPDIHIVPDPEAPNPHLIAETLAHVLSQSHNTGRKCKIDCYPIPVGPNQWIPYSIHFDSARQQIDVTIHGINPISASALVPNGFVSDTTHHIDIYAEPLSLCIEPMADGRAFLKMMPQIQQWSHSLVTALIISVLVSGIWGIATGIIAGGAYTLHLYADQWAFTGSALFWPFRKNRQPGFQWISPPQRRTMDFVLLWMASLLIFGNIIRTASPPIEGPSLLQLLLFGGATPLALFFRLRRKY